MAGRGDTLTKYHVEAGIAACHTLAASYEATDWKRILNGYDQLVTMTDSAVVALNRAVAVSMIERPDELSSVYKRRSLENYYLLNAILADFHARSGNKDKARSLCAGSRPRRHDAGGQFLARKPAALRPA
jgi:RNA polymerase sigma-70 factor (ECF subfamily)